MHCLKEPVRPQIKYYFFEITSSKNEYVTFFEKSHLKQIIFPEASKASKKYPRFFRTTEKTLRKSDINVI